MSLDHGFELRGVCRMGIIFKLKQNGIPGKLLNILSHILQDRK